MLVLDQSRAGWLLVGLKQRSVLRAKHIRLPSDTRQAVIAHAEVFLRSHNCSLRDVNSIAVVNGPGRFSGLRTVSVMANVFHWDRGARLFAARSRMEQIADPVAAAEDILMRAKPTQRISPRYGSRAHITKPKRRQQTVSRSPNVA